MRIITLEQLQLYCEKYNLSHYSSTDNDNAMVIVQVPGEFKEETSLKFSGEETVGLLPVTLQSCHIYENRNGSYISKATMKKAMPSFSNRPILGHIIQKDDGSYDFDSHNMEIIDDPWNEGGQRTHYIEQPIGIIPESCNARLEYDEEKEKTYVVVDGWIYEDYGNGAAEIIKEKGGTKVSVELGIKDFSYNPKKKRLEIEDFTFLGVTVLGEHVGEGMLGSNLKLSDFCSTENNMVDFAQVSEEIKELNMKIKHIEELYLKKGGNGLKLDELLQKYNVKEEDLDFEVEGLNDEELEKIFSEKFETDDASDVDAGDNLTEDELDSSTDVPDGNDSDADADLDSDMQVDGEGLEEDEEDTDEDVEKAETNNETPKKKTYSVNFGEKTYTFENSLDEVIYSLELLVNNTYSESDNAYYGVKVYDKYVVMVDYWTGKAFKQSYKVRSGSYSLTGDRVEVYARYVTKEEDAALDEMRSKFSEMETRLNDYIAKEEANKKQELITSEDYSSIADMEEFKELTKNIDDYSLSELTTKCDALLLQCAKQKNKFSASNTVDAKNKIRTVIKKEEKYSPYGTLFQEYK